MNKNVTFKNENNIMMEKNVIFNQSTMFNGEGEIFIGDNVVFGYHLAPHFQGFNCMIQARTINSVINIGDRTFFSNDVNIIAVREKNIGDNCLIGDRVTVIDCDFHEINPSTRNKSSGIIKPVNIGNNVWIGSGVTILKRVTIGDNAVIGVNSVVTKDVDMDSIVGGNPAEFISSVYK